MTVFDLLTTVEGWCDGPEAGADVNAGLTVSQTCVEILERVTGVGGRWSKCVNGAAMKGDRGETVRPSNRKKYAREYCCTQRL